MSDGDAGILPTGEGDVGAEERSRDEHRERLFAAGVAVGTALGLILGSFIALRVGENGLDSVRRALDRAIRREDRVKLELLLQ